MALFYNFKKGLTDRYLRSIGRLPRAVKSEFKSIEIENFDTLVASNKAVLTDTEAYILDANGKKQPIYFFKRAVYFFWSGSRKKNPKFHICRCEAVDNFGRDSYKAGNTKEATVRNRSAEGERQYTLDLELCGYCANQAARPNERTTKAFHDRIFADYQKNNPVDQNVKTGFDGYTLDWPHISKIYRAKRNYICEQCKVNLEDDRSFLHTHHINGNKLNNYQTNLEALCIECHFEEHEHPNSKFMKAKMQSQLKRFREKYR